jgi:hypothetical protein
MLRIFFTFVFVVIFSATVWAGNWNKAEKKVTASILITSEAQRIKETFKLKANKQVAVDTTMRLEEIGLEQVKKRCAGNFMETSGFIPNILNEVKAPKDYGLDERFTQTAFFFRKAAAQCLGGNQTSCKNIHTHALDYAKNSKIRQPRSGGAVFFNDTLTVSMRLTGPMASALGVAWNIADFPENEKSQINKWLEKTNISFQNQQRMKGSYKLDDFGLVVKKAGHNHAIQASIAMMSIASLTGNKDNFMTGVDQWFITLDTMREDGSLPIETRRGARAMFYHGRTISALFAIAKRAEVQGLDLLGIERKKSIHKAVQFYLDVADNPTLILEYAKNNDAPGPFKDYRTQDLDRAGTINSSGHGWVRLYIDRFPKHPNTIRLLNLEKGKNDISRNLSMSVVQKGKSTEWITVDTKCFYTKN